MTVTPSGASSWEPPAPGAYTRALRFGEWLGEPVTPLFESWLLPVMENRLHAQLGAWVGQHAPRPHHVVVNGWYFYSLNWIAPKAMLRSLPNILWHGIRAPRRVAGLLPATVRHSWPMFEREWREDLQPRYRAAVASAGLRVEEVPVSELPALIDDLGDLAGEYFASLVALAGAAYKAEINLAGFYRRHLARVPGASHLPLLAGIRPPDAIDGHAVVSLDWWHPTAPVAHRHEVNPDDHLRVVAVREAAEREAVEVLASSPRRLRAFRRLLDDAQHLVPVREEQARELTLPWPLMRRAHERIGAVLTRRGLIAEPDDVYFLTRPEVLAGLRDEPASPVDVAARRALRLRQKRLVPPVTIGRLNPALRRYWDGYPRLFGAVPSDNAIVSGVPASPGRVGGLVRVIHGPEQFDQLERGEILVAPVTAPAWTPLFERAAAVVTDVGSAAAHASIIAREYGIPAVVGCTDATTRLRTGMAVVVDGNTGNVTLDERAEARP